MLHHAMMNRLKNRLAVGGLPTNTGVMGPMSLTGMNRPTLPPNTQNPYSPIFGAQPPQVHMGWMGRPIPPPSAANAPPMSGAEMGGQPSMGAPANQPPPGSAGMNGPMPPGAAGPMAGGALGALANMQPGMGGPMMRPQVMNNPGVAPPQVPPGAMRGPMPRPMPTSGMRPMPMQGNRMIAARGGMVPPPGPSVPPGGYMPRPSALGSLIGHGMAAQHHGFGSPRKPRIPLPGTLRNISNMQNHAKIKLGSMGLG